MEGMPFWTLSSESNFIKHKILASPSRIALYHLLLEENLIIDLSKYYTFNGDSNIFTCCRDEYFKNQLLNRWSHLVEYKKNDMEKSISIINTLSDFCEKKYLNFYYSGLSLHNLYDRIKRDLPSVQKLLILYLVNNNTIEDEYPYIVKYKTSNNLLIQYTSELNLYIDIINLMLHKFNKLSVYDKFLVMDKIKKSECTFENIFRLNNSRYNNYCVNWIDGKSISSTSYNILYETWYKEINNMIK